MIHPNTNNKMENWVKINCCLLPVYDFANASELVDKFGIEFKCGLQLLRQVRQSICDQMDG